MNKCDICNKEIDFIQNLHSITIIMDCEYMLHKNVCENCKNKYINLIKNRFNMDVLEDDLK